MVRFISKSFSIVNSARGTIEESVRSWPQPSPLSRKPAQYSTTRPIYSRVGPTCASSRSCRRPMKIPVNPVPLVVGLVVVAIGVGGVFYMQRGAHIDLKGSILKVRTQVMDENSSVAVIDDSALMALR